MKRKTTYCIHIAVLAFFIAVVNPGCWWVLSPSPSPVVSFSYNSSVTGSFISHEFESPEDLAEFNRKAEDWFIARGFTELKGESFSELTGSKDWNKPGVLLRLKFDENNMFYVFIPESSNPEENVQTIGYHTVHQGNSEDEDTNGHDEFRKLENDFHKDFP